MRGNFGDPRTLFSTPPTTAGVLDGGGSFQFHFGVDISAPDGTRSIRSSPALSPTLPVTGWPSRAATGARFEYWHIDSDGARGDHVTAYGTVLGRVVRGTKHVHLTELQGRSPINPLQAGHLTPYTDRRPADRGDLDPKASARSSCRTSSAGTSTSSPRSRHGRTDPVQGSGENMPVSPARVTGTSRACPGRRCSGRRSRSTSGHHAPDTTPSGGSTHAAASRTWPSSERTTRSSSRAATCSGSGTPAARHADAARRRLRRCRHGERHPRQHELALAPVHGPQPFWLGRLLKPPLSIATAARPPGLVAAFGTFARRISVSTVVVSSDEVKMRMDA